MSERTHRLLEKARQGQLTASEGYELTGTFQYLYRCNGELRETVRLTEAFINAKGRYHSQMAMCDLLEHYGRPCVRPTTDDKETSSHDHP